MLEVGCSKSGCGDNPTTYVSGLAGYGHLFMASDGQSLYWTEVTTPPATRDFGHGLIRKCRIPTCDAEPTTVVSGLNTPGPLVVDDDYVYWIDVDATGDVGQIWRAGK